MQEGALPPQGCEARGYADDNNMTPDIELNPRSRPDQPDTPWVPEAADSEPPVKAVASSCDSLSVVSVRDVASAKPYIAAWEALAQSAAEPNVFFEPWMLLPAMRLYAPDRSSGRIELLLIVRRDAHGVESVAGVVPVEHQRRFRGLPLHSSSIWQHRHCYLCTPLMARGLEKECWQAVLDWTAQAGVGMFLEAANIAADGVVFRGLLDLVQERRTRMHVSGLYTRSLLEVGPDAETYLVRFVKKHEYKNHQRKRRHLEAVGVVQVTQLSSGDDLDRWLASFLDLEESGWKGREGTAINCDAADREYFKQIIREAFRRERLLASSLRLNGRMIAGQADIGAGVGAFSLKAAYDETYGRFSPGILLTVEIIRQMHRQNTIRWLDSCTAPGEHPTKHLWGQSRLLASVILPVRGWGSQLLVSLVPAVRHVLRRR